MYGFSFFIVFGNLNKSHPFLSWALIHPHVETNQFFPVSCLQLNTDIVWLQIRIWKQRWRACQAHSMEVRASDNLRSNVWKAFGFPSTQGKITSEDVVSWPRATWKHILSVTHLLQFHTVESKKLHLAAAEAEKDVRLLAHERLGLRNTMCINPIAKVVTYIAVSNVRLLSSVQNV